MTWYYGLSVWMHGKLFPFWDSYNTSSLTGRAGLSFCCAFCGLAICTAFSFLTYNEYSLYLCPFSLHLKHSTSTTPILLIVLFSTPHCIILLLNTSNLFWGTTVLFPSSFCFLQFRTRCPNPLQLKHSFSLLLSSSSLSLVRVCFSLSILLINELYCCKDIVLRLYKGTDLMVSLTTVMFVGTQDLYLTKYLLPYWLLP